MVSINVIEVNNNPLKLKEGKMKLSSLFFENILFNYLAVQAL